MKSIIDNLYQNYNRSNWKEIELLQFVFNRMDWESLSDEEKHKNRDAALSFGMRDVQDSNAPIFLYGKRLVSFDLTLKKLIVTIEKDYVDTTLQSKDINIQRFLSLLYAEKYYMNESLKPKNHISPILFQNMIDKLSQTYDELYLHQFLEEYEAMYNIWLAVSENKP